MAFNWRLCFNVIGIMINRTISVNIRMLMPKLLKNMLYNSTRLLTMGPMMTAFQMSPITSTV